MEEHSHLPVWQVIRERTGLPWIPRKDRDSRLPRVTDRFGTERGRLSLPIQIRRKALHYVITVQGVAFEPVCFQNGHIQVVDPAIAVEVARDRHVIGQ